MKLGLDYFFSDKNVEGNLWLGIYNDEGKMTVKVTRLSPKDTVSAASKLQPIKHQLSVGGPPLPAGCGQELRAACLYRVDYLKFGVVLLAQFDDEGTKKHKALYCLNATVIKSSHEVAFALSVGHPVELFFYLTDDLSVAPMFESPGYQYRSVYSFQLFVNQDPVKLERFVLNDNHTEL
jgi:hypothetical protein